MNPMNRIHAPGGGANLPERRRFLHGLQSAGVAGLATAIDEPPALAALPDPEGQGPGAEGSLPLADEPQSQLHPQLAGGEAPLAATAATATEAAPPPAQEHTGMDAPAAQPQPAAMQALTFADMLLKAVHERTQRAEKSVLRSMAAQSGITEGALGSILAAARAGHTRPAGQPAPEDSAAETALAASPEQAAQTMQPAGDATAAQTMQLAQSAQAPKAEPPTQMEATKAPAPQEDRSAVLGRRLVAAELRRIGEQMGLVDAEVALALIDPEAMTVSEAGEVAGVTEALNALKAQKGYLFARAGGAWAERLGGGLASISGVEEAFYRKNPALRK